MDPLVNPVWHALGGEQSPYAEVHETARRYLPDVSVFGGVPDAPGPGDWDALRELVGPGGEAFLLREPVQPPDDWPVTFRLGGLQMVADRRAADAIDESEAEVVQLGEADVSDVLDLIAVSNPGPFTPRTMELGTYLGLRIDGTLVALSGERMRPPGATEVSAVCTHPDHRGRGLAALLVQAVMDLIRARDETPILHVLATNDTAIRVYERLGFRTSRAIEGISLIAPA